MNSNKFQKLKFSEDSERFLTYLLIGLSIIVLISLGIFALKTYIYRFNSDGATAAMISYEQLGTGQLFIKDWYYSQDFWPFFIFNPATLLYPIVGNAFLATQIPVLIQSIIVFFLSYQLLNKMCRSNLNLLILSFAFSGVSYIWAEYFWGQGQYGNVLIERSLSNIVIALKAAHQS